MDGLSYTVGVSGILSGSGKGEELRRIYLQYDTLRHCMICILVVRVIWIIERNHPSG